MSRPHVAPPSAWASDTPAPGPPRLRDGDGRLPDVPLSGTPLGSHVTWTPAGRPWDGHGSRSVVDGEVPHGPPSPPLGGETASVGKPTRAPAPRVWTVGHSNRPLEDFLALLEQARVEQVADVRRFPGSRRWPHFSGDALRASLADRGVGYVHLPALGGRRGTPAEGSPNTGWRVPSFAAYADYMATEPFEQGREALERLAVGRRTAMMCSEAVPWRCHRRLIADALLVRGWEVLDILGNGRAEPRALTEFARVRDGALTYPGTP